MLSRDVPKGAPTVWLCQKQHKTKMMRGEGGMKLTIRLLTAGLWSAFEDPFGACGAVRDRW
jgi:hypothetical protein